MAGLVFAQARYTDPDSAATNAAARGALGNGKLIDISGATSEIVGVTSGIHGLLEDLGAKVIGQELRIDLASDVLFDFDRHTWYKKWRQVLLVYPRYSSVLPR